MNKKIINYFLIFLISIVRLQFTSPAIIKDSIRIIDIDGKRTLTTLDRTKTNDILGFYAWDLSLDKIESDVFSKCAGVTEIYLHKNQIKELHPDTFKFCTDTLTIALDCNKLSFLPDELLKPLINLAHLDLAGNSLISIKPILKSELKKLNRLSIAGNALHGLNIEDIEEGLPKLKNIWFDKNFIECSEYESLEKELLKNGIISDQSEQDCVFKLKKCLTPTEERTIKLMTPLINKQQKILETIQQTSDNFIDIKNQQVQTESKIEMKIKEINLKIETQKEDMIKESDGVKKSIDNFTKLFLETSRNFSMHIGQNPIIIKNEWTTLTLTQNESTRQNRKEVLNNKIIC